MRADLLMVVWIVFPVVCVCVCWEFGFFLSNHSKVHQESTLEPGHLQRLCICARARALQVSGLSVMNDSASQMRFW